MDLDRLDPGRLVVAFDVFRQAVAAAIFWRWLEFGLNDFRQCGSGHGNDCGSSRSRSGGPEEEPPTGRFRLAVLHGLSAIKVGIQFIVIVRHRSCDFNATTLKIDKKLGKTLIKRIFLNVAFKIRHLGLVLKAQASMSKPCDSTLVKAWVKLARLV